MLENFYHKKKLSHVCTHFMCNVVFLQISWGAENELCNWAWKWRSLHEYSVGYFISPYFLFIKLICYTHLIAITLGTFLPQHTPLCIFAIFPAKLSIAIKSIKKHLSFIITLLFLFTLFWYHRLEDFVRISILRSRGFGKEEFSCDTVCS